MKIVDCRFKISDLSCGLPPFGRVPSFGMRNADLKRTKEGDELFVDRLAFMKLTADGSRPIAELDWEKQMSGTAEMGGEVPPASLARSDLAKLGEAEIT